MSTLSSIINSVATLISVDFYERFKSFWAAPSGARVAELIAPATKASCSASACSGWP